MASDHSAHLPLRNHVPPKTQALSIMPALTREPSPGLSNGEAINFNNTTTASGWENGQCSFFASPKLISLTPPSTQHVRNHSRCSPDRCPRRSQN